MSSIQPTHLPRTLVFWGYFTLCLLFQATTFKNFVFLDFFISDPLLKKKKDNILSWDVLY